MLENVVERCEWSPDNTELEDLRQTVLKRKALLYKLLDCFDVEPVASLLYEVQREATRLKLINRWSSASKKKRKKRTSSVVSLARCCALVVPLVSSGLCWSRLVLVSLLVADIFIFSDNLIPII